MSYFPNEKDIFLWADGYWCYREDFHSQPRQTYAYRLILANSSQWNSLTGAELYQRNPHSASQEDRRNHDRRHG